MKLSLGSGSKKIDGFLNVDQYSTFTTDVVFDLEAIPWTWAANSVDAIGLVHSLERMGCDKETCLSIIRELYRICTDSAVITNHVPHPRHDDFLGDPTHLSGIVPQPLMLFDKAKNDEWVPSRESSAAPLSQYFEMNFYIAGLTTVFDSPHYEGH